MSYCEKSPNGRHTPGMDMHCATQCEVSTVFQATCHHCNASMSITFNHSSWEVEEPEPGPNDCPYTTNGHDFGDKGKRTECWHCEALNPAGGGA